jgi:Tol biopolymer transport system component
MGQVFRAYDEVLRRRVAVKLLRAAREEGSGEGSAPTVARILREARMAAALDHPNVVSIFDFGEDGGVPYIVMELVAGRPLRALVGDLSIPVDERLRWLVDVARALAAAHKAGLVHRDIKPENVLLRDDGGIKVLDFGIARRAANPAHPQSVRAGGPAPGPGAPGGPPTTLTFDEGHVAGTPGYMAPEQIMGGVVDARVDQFAWGVLAHEILSGKLPWKATRREGSIMLEVLSDAPATLATGEMRAPAPVIATIERALRKDPAQRFESMGQLLDGLGHRPTAAAKGAPSGAAAELGEAKTERADSLASPAAATDGDLGTTTKKRPRRGPAAWGFALAALAAALGTTVVLRPRSAPPVVSSPAPAAPPPEPGFRPHDAKRVTFGYACEEFPSLTPDGRVVVYDGEAGGDYHVYALDLATGVQRQVTSGAGWQYAPYLSPDGRTVAFLRKDQGHLTQSVIPLDGDGGGERVVGKGRIRPRWSPDGKALWIGHEKAERVDLATGEITRTIEAPEGSLPITVNELADGRALVLFIERETHRFRGVALYPAGSGEPRWLTHERLDEVLTVTPDGAHVIVAHIDPTNESELWRLPFDGGAPTKLEQPGVPPNKGLAFSASGDRAVWSDCGIQARLTLLTRERGGGFAAKPMFPNAEWTDDAPSGIPGTSRVVVLSDRSDGDHLWVIDTAGREPPREIATPGLTPGAAAPSPDGRWVVFGTVHGGIYVAAMDGSSPPRQLTGGAADTSPSFGRDGSVVYFETRDGNGEPRVAMVPFAGGEATPLLGPGSASPSASPASEVIAYVALEGDGGDTGRPMLFDLRTHASRALTTKVTVHREAAVRLSPDGKRAALGSGTEITEIDLATGNVVGRFDAGADQIKGLAYLERDLLTSRHVWAGDVWAGSDPLR